MAAGQGDKPIDKPDEGLAPATISAPSLQFVHLDRQTHRSIHASVILPDLGRLTNRGRSKIGFGGENIPTPPAKSVADSKSCYYFPRNSTPSANCHWQAEGGRAARKS